jgi:hypothetical protein
VNSTRAVPAFTIGNAPTGTPLPPLPGSSPLRRAVTSKQAATLAADDQLRHLGF